VLVKTIKYGGPNISQGLKAVSCSDAFLKALIGRAKELAQRGFQLWLEGKVAGFRLWPKEMAASL
jgi:hypothetical protein